MEFMFRDVPLKKTFSLNFILNMILFMLLTYAMELYAVSSSPAGSTLDYFVLQGLPWLNDHGNSFLESVKM